MLSLFESIHWLQNHFIELIAVVTGFLNVLYAIKKSNLLWLFGIVSSGLYVWIFLTSDIYGYTALYSYYVIISIYGWYNWVKPVKGPHHEDELMVRNTPKSHLRLYLILTGVFTLLIYLALAGLRFYFNIGSDVAFTDALLTAASIVATWMLTQKLIEQWLFWILIDLASSVEMFYKGLYPSALLFLAYTILALKGYLEWKKELKANPAN
jgi:nicotinamide mononucleotide transporter